MKTLKPTRDPNKVTQAELLPFGVTLRRILTWTDAGQVNDLELTCRHCGDIWIPRRIGTQFGYLRIIRLGSQLSHRYWVCSLNGCNAAPVFDDGSERKISNAFQCEALTQ